MPLAYTQTRDINNIWQVAHPIHGPCKGGSIATYPSKIPINLGRLFIGKHQVVKKTEACLDNRRYTFVTDPRMVLRPAIDRGEIHVLELLNKNGALVGLALVRAPLGIESIQTGLILNQSKIEVIDYVKWKKIESAEQEGPQKFHRHKIEDLFPNSACLEMWGKKLSSYRGGAGINFNGQLITLGTAEDSPHHQKEEAEQVLFSCNPQTGIISAGVVNRSNQELQLDDFGTLIVDDKRVSSNGLSIQRHPGTFKRIGFEELCEQAAIVREVTNPHSLSIEKLDLSFADPPKDSMLTEGKLFCRVWYGGIRVDWARKIDGKEAVRTYRVAFAKDGTILDGLGHPVRINGRTPNIRTDKAQDLPRINFWKLLAARIPKGLAGKTPCSPARISEGLQKLIAGEELPEGFFNQYACLDLNKGVFIFKVPAKRGSVTIPFTHSTLLDKYQKGGKIYVAFERTEDGVTLTAYTMQKEPLVSLDVDTKQKCFCYRRYRGEENQKTYIILAEPGKIISIAGKRVFPHGRTRGIYLVDVDFTPKGRVKTLLRIKKPDVSLAEEPPLRPVLNDKGQAVAYILNTNSPGSFIQLIHGWLPISKWAFNSYGGISFTWSKLEKRVGQQATHALDLKENETLWVKAEGEEIVAVATITEKKLSNIQHFKVARDHRGEIVKSVSKKMPLSVLGEAQVFSGFITRQSGSNEVVQVGKRQEMKELIIRPLTPGEEFIPRAISFVTHLGKDREETPSVVLVHNTPIWKGIMYDIALAAADTGSSEAIAALQKAEIMYTAGRSEQEIATHLFSQDYLLLKERFYKKAAGGRAWARKQREEAAERQKLIRAIKKHFSLLLKNEQYIYPATFVAEVESLLKELRALSESESQSIIVRRQNIAAYFFSRRIIILLARFLYPVIIQSRSLEASEEIIAGFRQVVEGRISLSTGKKEQDAEINIPERLEEISAFLKSLDQAAQMRSTN